jgi:hypothetical protein
MELDSLEGTVVAWDESLTTFTRVLGEACMGHDASSTHAGATRRDYLTQASASSSQYEWHKALRWTLDERVTLLCLQEIDLRVCEVILADELEHGQRHHDGHDLPVELDDAHAQVHGIADDQATEAGWLSRCPDRHGPNTY